MKEIIKIIGIVILLVLVTGIYRFNDDDDYVKNNQNTLVKSHKMPSDLAIEKYLLSQDDFVWQTVINSQKACVFENIGERKDNLFPLSLWVFCQEYIVKNGEIIELSGSSGPAIINYPNEESSFNLEKLTHQRPRDGSLYSKDIKQMFSKKAQRVIFNHSVTARLVEKMKNKITHYYRKIP
ncbi:MAG: hypothetical protein ABFS56_25935 [Pseudomonadota bacterium]